MKKFFTLCSLPILIFSCSSPQKEKNEKKFTELQKASWLIGNWQNISDQGDVTETWVTQNDSTYAGASYFVQGRDTLASESIRLVQQDDGLFYIPTVKNQNEDKPVPFKLTSSTSDLLIFENAEHDFPQKISYRLVNPDSIVAEISGTITGEARSEQFPFSRAR